LTADIHAMGTGGINSLEKLLHRTDDELLVVVQRRHERGQDAAIQCSFDDSFKAFD
jgi:hypothetical protein